MLLRPELRSIIDNDILLMKRTNKGKPTIDSQSMEYGIRHNEPLLVILDAIYRYGKAHERRYECKIATDGVAGPAIAQQLKSTRDLFCCHGGAALQFNRSTDSKCNGTMEKLFWFIADELGYGQTDIVC